MTTLSTMSLPSPENLAAETARFYAEVADSFSATRDHPWPGWQRAMREAQVFGGNRRFEQASTNNCPIPLAERRPDLVSAAGLWQCACGTLPCDAEQLVAGKGPNLEETGLAESSLSADSRTVFSKAISIVDFACGNMRFEDWLQPSHAICIDNCEQLVPEGREFINCNLLKQTPDVSADLAVCFGFMHHIPTPEQREALLDQMAKSNVAIVTFWQFLNSEKIAAKAELIEGNDYWLHWQDRTDIKRYCHNYTDSEIAELMAPYEILAEFQEDGRNHNLNHYVVFCRKDN